MNRFSSAVLLAALGAGAFWLWQDRNETELAASGSPLVQVAMPATLSAQAADGARAFATNCASCHGENAAGRDGIAPPLIHKIYEPSHHSDMAFILAARNGVPAHHWPFGSMAPVPGVTDTDLAGIIRFVREVQVANGIL